MLDQREQDRKAAATGLDKNGNRPPEVRLGRISPTGRVHIEFTNEMDLPSLDDFIQLNKKQSPSLISITMLEGVTENQN